MSSSLPTRFLLNDLIIDCKRLQLKAKGDWQPIEAKQLALLLILAEQQGEAVKREALIEQLWPDTIVSDNSISQLVVQLRKTLGDTKSDSTFIKTVPRVGYQLIAEIAPAPELFDTLLAPTQYRPVYWLLSGTCFGASLVALLQADFWHVKEQLEYTYQSRLTSSPGAEVFLRYSPSGRYLAFSHQSNNKSQFDLAVFDMQTNTLHNIKNTGFSEESPVWSADGKWLAYYRFDPFNCQVRAISVQNTIEMWRLSPEVKLFDCDPSLEPQKLFWTHNNDIVLSQNSGSIYELYTYYFNDALEQTRAHTRKEIDGKIYDVEPMNNQALMITNSNQEVSGQLYQLDLASVNLDTVKLKDNVNAPVAWSDDQQSIWFGQTSLSKQALNSENQLIVHRPLGVITDIAVAESQGYVAHSQGIAQVNLYHLDTNTFVAEGDILPITNISSAAKIDTLAQASEDGNVVVFVSNELQQQSLLKQTEIWVKHKHRPTANLLATLEDNARPEFLLLSPDNANIVVKTVNNELFIINLFSKTPVKVSSGFSFIRNLAWSEQGDSLAYQTSQQGSQWQSWRYSLPQASNQVAQVPFVDKTIWEQNRSYVDFDSNVREMLIKALAGEFDAQQLQASFSLYKPAVFEQGVYFVLRQGRHLSLFLYEKQSGTHRFISEIGHYLYDINIDMSLSTSRDGSQVYFNKVDGIETDIVLHKRVKASE